MLVHTLNAFQHFLKVSVYIYKKTVTVVDLHVLFQLSSVPNTLILYSKVYFHLFIKPQRYLVLPLPILRSLKSHCPLDPVSQFKKDTKGYNLFKTSTFTKTIDT